MVACSDLGSTQFVIFNTDTTLMFTAPCIVTSKKKKNKKKGEMEEEGVVEMAFNCGEPLFSSFIKWG